MPGASTSATPSAGASGGTGAATPAANALKVVTTTTVFADIVQNVGGDRVAALADLKTKLEESA